MLKQVSGLIFLMSLLFLGSSLTSCSKSDSSSTTSIVPFSEEVSTDTDDDPVAAIQTEFKKLYNYPDLTLILVPKGDVQRSIRNLKEGGAHLLYDPNLGKGSLIPWYLAKISAELIHNQEFMKSLNIDTFAFDLDLDDSDFEKNRIMPIGLKTAAEEALEEEFALEISSRGELIPKNGMQLSELADQYFSGGKKQLGEGITVAVIDTGVDTGNEAFGNRVVYWYDATEEYHISFEEVEISSKQKKIKFEGQEYELPKNLNTDAKFYMAIVDEKKLVAQFPSRDKKDDAFFDLNYNGEEDQFAVLLEVTNKGEKIFFDSSADRKFTGKDARALIDYNQTGYDNREQGQIEFYSKRGKVRYPIVLLRDQKERPVLQLGISNGSHGTHVAGIIASNLEVAGLHGIAPAANIMSLKACNRLSCSNFAIVKSLYQAFYNGKHVPHIVNISLGSHEGRGRDFYGRLIDDLATKFGALFFVAGSNSGPGFRTLNSIGNSGSAIQVGANVSRQTLQEQYNHTDNHELAEQGILSFSSLGPSYTGEMKPNIMAPGGAIAPVLTFGGQLSHMNGTSMSSPSAAGVAAAILSALKKEEHPFFAFREERIKSVLEGEFQESLMPHVLAMREGIQRGARRLDHLVTPQQGFGLIQAFDGAKLVDRLLNEVIEEKRSYFEVELVGVNYQRKTIRPHHFFELAYRRSPVVSHLEEYAQRSLNLHVKLVRVEKLYSDGSVEIAEDPLNYFFILRSGDQGKYLHTEVAMNNQRNRGFVSKRNLEAMEEGVSYIAHYKIFHGKNKSLVQNILDVVHMPYTPQNVTVTQLGINSSRREFPSAIAKSDIQMGENQIHRYFFEMDGQNNRASVQIGIHPEDDGVFLAALYDPNGRERAFSFVVRTPIHRERVADFSVQIDREELDELSGLWELTIASASSQWPGAARYDLLIDKNENIRSSHREVNLTQKTSETVLIEYVEDFFDLPNNLRRQDREHVRVKTAHTSFHPLSLREGETELRAFLLTWGAENTNASYRGGLKPNLFLKLAKDGQEIFVPYTNSRVDPSFGAFNIRLAPTTEQLYLGIDTYYALSSNPKPFITLVLESREQIKFSDILTITSTAVPSYNKKTVKSHFEKKPLEEVEKAVDLTPRSENSKVYFVGEWTIINFTDNLEIISLPVSVTIDNE